MLIQSSLKQMSKVAVIIVAMVTVLSARGPNEGQQETGESSDVSFWIESLFVGSLSDRTIVSTFSGGEILSKFLASSETPQLNSATESTNPWISYGNVGDTVQAVRFYKAIEAKYSADCFEVKADAKIYESRYLYHRACSKSLYSAHSDYKSECTRKLF
jgi:hypothetical protein